MHGVIQKVRSLKKGGTEDGHWNANKNKQGENFIFFKNAEIFKMKFYSYSPVFPL